MMFSSPRSWLCCNMVHTVMYVSAALQMLRLRRLFSDMSNFGKCQSTFCKIICFFPFQVLCCHRWTTFWLELVVSTISLLATHHHSKYVKVWQFETWFSTRESVRPTCLSWKSASQTEGSQFFLSPASDHPELTRVIFSMGSRIQNPSTIGIVFLDKNTVCIFNT